MSFNTTSNIWSFLPFYLCSDNSGSFKGIWHPTGLAPLSALQAAALALVPEVICTKQRRAVECLVTTIPVKWDKMKKRGCGSLIGSDEMKYTCATLTFLSQVWMSCCSFLHLILASKYSLMSGTSWFAIWRRKCRFRFSAFKSPWRH